MTESDLKYVGAQARKASELVDKMESLIDAGQADRFRLAARHPDREVHWKDVPISNEALEQCAVLLIRMELVNIAATLEKLALHPTQEERQNRNEQEQQIPF